MNKKDDYLINYDKIKECTINETVTKLNNINGLPLSKCTISKLVFYNNKSILTGNGVYFFKNDKRNIYVGCCSSKNFVERIPAHFNVKNTGWFNSHLRNFVNHERKNVIKDWKEPENPKHAKIYTDLLLEAARYSLDSHKLILINFKPSDYSKDDINILEYILKIVLEPLNTFKTKQISNNDREIKICDFKK